MFLGRFVVLSIAAVLYPMLAFGSNIKQSFFYEVRTNRHEVIGSYEVHFETLNQPNSRDHLRVHSKLQVDSRLFFFTVFIDNEEWFVHDGDRIIEFEIREERKVPFSSRKWVRHHARIEADRTLINKLNQEGKVIDQISIDTSDFSDIKNMSSRLLQSGKLVNRGNQETALTLDPFSLEIFPIKTVGLDNQTIIFDGSEHKLHVVERSSKEGEIRVHMFSDSLIHRIESRWIYMVLTRSQPSPYRPRQPKSDLQIHRQKKIATDHCLIKKLAFPS